MIRDCQCCARNRYRTAVSIPPGMIRDVTSGIIGSPQGGRFNPSRDDQGRPQRWSRRRAGPVVSIPPGMIRDILLAGGSRTDMPVSIPPGMIRDRPARLCSWGFRSVSIPPGMIRDWGVVLIRGGIRTVSIPPGMIRDSRNRCAGSAATYGFNPSRDDQGPRHAR